MRARVRNGLTLIEIVIMMAVLAVAILAFMNRSDCGSSDKSMAWYLDDKAACTWWEEHDICVCAHKGAWAFQASDKACIVGE